MTNFFNSVRVKAHESCQGLESGCHTCSAALPAAQASMGSLDQMMQDCALVFNTKGDMTVSQRHVFLGIIFDTVKGRIFVTKEKFDKMLALMNEIMNLQTC